MNANETRALHIYEKMGEIRDDYILDAEIPAGILPVPASRFGGLRRFLNSGWCAAMLSGIVALAVLIFIVRAGLNAPVTYDPPPKPTGGCSIEMSDHGVNYTVTTDQENYPVGTDRIKIIMTGKVKGERITDYNALYLERVFAEHAERVDFSWSGLLDDEPPPKNEYARCDMRLRTPEPLTAGTYRLHAVIYDGEKYVSVAYCTFTVGDPEGETRPVLDYPPAEEQLYTVEASDMTYGSGGSVWVKITATEKGASLYVMPPAFAVVKLAGPANVSNTGWDTAEVLIPEIKPSAQDGGYAVFRTELALGDGWLPGLYRLYALTDDGSSAYIDYCDFTIHPSDMGLPYSVSMARLMYTETSTHLSIRFQAHEAGQPISRGDCWSLWRVENGERISMGSQSAEYALEGAEVAPDEYAVEQYHPTISLVTGGQYETLPVGQYELVFSEGYGVTLTFEVVSLPEDVLEAGVGSIQGYFLRDSRSSYILYTYGEGYRDAYMLIPADNLVGDPDSLSSGDFVEILAWNFIEPVPPCATVGAVKKLRDGTLDDIPDIYDEVLERYGIEPAP